MADVTIIHDCDIERLAVPDAVEGAFRDGMMSESAPIAPAGEGANIIIGRSDVPKGDPAQNYCLYYFDLNAFLPASAAITAARLHFYVHISDLLEAHRVHAHRIDFDTFPWVEAEFSWNEYRDGDDWTDAGRDGTTPDVDFGEIDGTGWFDRDLIDLVSDAWDDRAGICTFVLRRDDAFPDAAGRIYLWAKERHDTSPALIPHLRVTYTLDGRTFQVLSR